MADEKKRKGWFYPLYSWDDASAAIKETSTVFFGVAALQLAVVVLLLKEYANIADVVLLVVLAFLVRRFHSRVAAVLLLLLVLAEAGVTVAGKLNPELRSGGTNIFLAAALVAAALRGVQATFKLRRLPRSESPSLRSALG
jgi:hypothetical protein